MKTPIKAAIGALMVLAPLGCSAPPESASDPSTDTSVQIPEPDHGLAEEPEPLPSERGRTARRLTVEQWRGTLAHLTGGLSWTENFGQGDIDMVALLRASLGAPDFTIVTEESLEPNLLWAKLSADAAERLCPRWVAVEQERAMDKRTLILHGDPTSTDEQLVRASLQALILSAFGRAPHATGSQTHEDALWKLFQAAGQGAQTNQHARDGWVAVCLAVMTHPEFMLY